MDASRLLSLPVFFMPLPDFKDSGRLSFGTALESHQKRRIRDRFQGKSKPDSLE
jgi:hypothetical protein